MYMFMLSGYRNAMNMAQAIELGIHCLGHFFICPALQGVCVWVTGMGLLHFQQSRDELVWVTIVCKAAIFLALCLHSAVDELHVLRQHSNKPIRKPSENVSKGRTQRRKASLMRAKIV